MFLPEITTSVRREQQVCSQSCYVYQMINKIYEKNEKGIRSEYPSETKQINEQKLCTILMALSLFS